MKHLSSYISAVFTICFLAVCINTTAFSGETTNPETTCYWIYVGPKYQKTTDNQKLYEIGFISSINDGNYKIFRREIWENFKIRKITIGPFRSEKFAEYANQIYNKRYLSDFLHNTDTGKEVYWFSISFRYNERIGSYQLVKSTPSLESGTVQHFTDALYQNMSNTNFVIGPFSSSESANTAIELYKEHQ